jgi:hypothetical protein
MTLHPELPTTPFTRAAAGRLGISGRDLTDLLAAHRIRRVLRNVYVAADQPDTVECRAAAAAMVLTPQAVFVDRTAAWLHGVDVFRYRELEVLPPLECVVLSGRARVVRPECTGGERDLAPYDVMWVHGLRVTTPLRTAMDLACRLGRPDGLAELDMFMRMHGVRHVDLDGSLGRYRRRRGVTRLRDLAPLASPLSESVRESYTRLAIHDADLPAPTLQHWVVHRGVPLFRLDLAWPRCRVAVEYDGADWHETAEQRSADRRRRSWLRQHGWTVIVMRRGQLAAGSRQGWLAELRTGLGMS